MEEHAPGMAPTTFFAAVEQCFLLEIAMLNVVRCGFGRTNRHIDNANFDDFDPLGVSIRLILMLMLILMTNGSCL